MIFFFKDGIRLDSFEFGLKIADGVTVRAAIGMTSSVGEVVAIILGLVTRSAPVVLLFYAFSGRLWQTSLPITFSSPLLLSLSLGPCRHGLIWRSSEGDAQRLQRYRRPDRSGHGHSACRSESLHALAVAGLSDSFKVQGKLQGRPVT